MCKSDTCSICLDSCVVPNRIDMRRLKIRSSGELKRVGEKLRCGHVFHRQCILPWFLNVENEASDNCPMCRQHIRFSNKVGMFNWRLFSRKIHLWNIAELERQEEEYTHDYSQDQEDDYSQDQEDQEDDYSQDQDGQDQDGQDQEDDYSKDQDGQDQDGQDQDHDQLSSISSGDTDDDESDWFDADDWTYTIPPQSSITYGMRFSFIKFIITQQKLTLAKLHAMRFNRLTNNICRNRHR